MSRPILWVEVRHGPEGFCARYQCMGPDFTVRPPADPMHCGTPGCRWQHACVGCGRLGHGITCCPERLTPAELRQLEAQEA
eukprot:7777595-Lingulodinium_polyedra.AAC.1